MNVKFLREQDGPIERELKGKLEPLLRSAPDVLSAYLAVVDYQDGASPSVALCLSLPGGQDETRQHLVSDVGGIFRDMFSRAEHLDVFFINPGEELALKAVCRPFYLATSS